MNPNVAVRVQNVSKTYLNKALDNVSFDVNEGEFTALIGPSGSGKSTLMRHLSGLVTSDAKSDCIIEVNGQTIQQSGKLVRDIRKQRRHIGCIFQQFNLVNRLSVLNNVLIGFLGNIPAWRGYVGYFTTAEKQKAMSALDRVGLAHIAMQRASSLSGGQQQRVAIARALVQDAKIILADEPIASLDPTAARQVMQMLQDINKQDGKTVLVTLHQVDVARRYCDNTIALKDGKLYYQGATSELTDARLTALYDNQVAELFENKYPISTSDTPQRPKDVLAPYLDVPNTTEVQKAIPQEVQNVTQQAVQQSDPHQTHQVTPASKLATVSQKKEST